MPEKVFHIRLPRFPVQTERVVDPRLTTRAVGIVSSDRSSGTLIATSVEAEQEGIRPGMPVSLVQKMSPRTVLLPANRSLYHKVNQVIYDVVNSLCPVVEPGGFGQFYMDMHGMGHIYQSDRRAGDLVMQTIEEKADLSSHVGISRNKLVSAISTRVVPERLYAVDSGVEDRFLAPLESGNLPVTERKPVRAAVADLNAKLIQDMQELTVHDYAARVIFGQYAVPARRQSHGIDTSAVKPPAIRDHIVERRILREDTNHEETLRNTVRLLAEQVAFQLREQGRVADKAVFSIHYTDGYENSATGKLAHYSDRAVTKELHRLYDRANIRRNRVRSVMVDVSEFRPFAEQMDLFDDAPTAKEDALSGQLDTLRRKYGFDVVKPAAHLMQAA